jgi:Cu+-exporting ATPase
MSTVNIKTSGTTCSSCSMLIEMNVSDLPGVEEVRASHPDNLTVVTYDPAAVSAEQIAEEIRRAGYDAEIQA